MLEKDIGVLPVIAGNRLVGIVTDRDITVRAVASGLEADGNVRDITTSMSNAVVSRGVV